MDLLFPRLTPLRLAIFVVLFTVCLFSGAPIRGDEMMLAEPLAIIGAGVAVGALSGGAQLLGQHIARKQYAKSAVGKAEAAIARQSARTAKKSLKKLGLSEKQKRKAVTMAMRSARSRMRQFKQEERRGQKYQGPARSGMAAMRGIEMEQGMLQVGAGARGEVERRSLAQALGRKAAAVGTVLPMAQARRQEMLATGALAGQTAAGGIMGGASAGMAYGAGASSAGTGTGTGAAASTSPAVVP